MVANETRTRAAGEGFAKVTAEQSPEGSEGLGHVDMGKKFREGTEQEAPITGQSEPRKGHGWGRRRLTEGLIAWLPTLGHRARDRSWRHHRHRGCYPPSNKQALNGSTRGDEPTRLGKANSKPPDDGGHGTCPNLPLHQASFSDLSMN